MSLISYPTLLTVQCLVYGRHLVNAWWISKCMCNNNEKSSLCEKDLLVMSSVFSRADIWTHSLFSCREKATFNCLFTVVVVVVDLSCLLLFKFLFKRISKPSEPSQNDYWTIYFLSPKQAVWCKTFLRV